MDAQPILTRPSEVRALLAQLDFRPARILGQNFLIDRNILNILLREADVQPDDAVLEVGPGLGVLTAALLDTVKTVTAVEKDKRLAAYLRERFADAPSLHLIQADILDCDLPALLAAPETKLVANLPYAIAARLLVELTALTTPPPCIVVTIQREVAERLTATPGMKDYGLLAILLQRLYDIQTVKHVTPSCFWPPPEVQSSIVKLTRRAQPLGGTATDAAALRSLVRHAFSQRRKTLGRSLRGFLVDPSAALKAADIPPAARAEEIPPEKWVTLSTAPQLPPLFCSCPRPL